MSTEVMKRALEYLQENEGCIADVSSSQYVKEYYEFMERFAGVIKQAEQQEPVAWIDRHELSAIDEDFSPSVGNRKLSEYDVPLYTAPPQRQPLTDEELIECERLADIRHRKHMGSIRGQQLSPADQFLWHYARAIEAAHGIVENTWLKFKSYAKH